MMIMNREKMIGVFCYVNNCFGSTCHPADEKCINCVPPCPFELSMNLLTTLSQHRPVHMMISNFVTIHEKYGDTKINGIPFTKNSKNRFSDMVRKYISISTSLIDYYCSDWGDEGLDEDAEKWNDEEDDGYEFKKFNMRRRILLMGIKRMIMKTKK